jgi:predicted nucleic acid-binding protein
MTTGDVQIAGIAGAYGLTLVTRNVKDFAATGIDLVNPWGD